MAKVKFVIVGGGEQPGLKLGKDERPPDHYQHDLGALQLEDKSIMGVVAGIQKQTGTGEKIQAWSKEHGRDGWILRVEKGGFSRQSYGAVSADDQPDTKHEDE